MSTFLGLLVLFGVPCCLFWLFEAYAAYDKEKPHREYQAWVQKGAEHYSNCYDYTEVMKKILHVYNLDMITICENTRIETFELYIFFNSDGNLSYDRTNPIGYEESSITSKGKVLIDYNKDNIIIENRVGYLKALADTLKHELNYELNYKADVFCNADAVNRTYIHLSQKNPSYIPPRMI